MANSSDGVLNGLYDDTASDIDAGCSRRDKRRRLNNSFSDTNSETDLENSCHLGRRSPSLDNASLQERDNGEQDGEKERPKSKYKIHIPKNSDLPRDAFFTQPPQRSSSPYRIDEFHWRKPQKPHPAQLTKPSRKLPKNAHPNSSPVPLQLTNNNAVSRGRIPEAIDLSDYDSDYDDDHLFDGMLDDIGDDEFAVQNTVNTSKPVPIQSEANDLARPGDDQRLRAPLVNLKQTTLFGTQAQEAPNETQSNRKHNWPLANREEPQTHHKLNLEALNTWVYPTNLGTIRDYQYSIVAKGLYHNLLIALPTGLGKTFIAATIMLNWFRWTIDAQIVFVAPTKPLVSQQVKACFEIAGIPRSATSMLTGSTPPGLRAEEWNTKRVFFMTPQTIVNDLKTGICNPKRLVLLVIDEAHRATGNYAYVEVVKFVRRFNSSFRVLALTATPGSSIETVQEVIDGLGISRVEIRTEESIDIRQYVHPRKIETILFDNSEEMIMVMDLFSKALQPVVNILNGNNAYWSKDPMSLTPYGCNQARQRWMSDVGRSASWAEKGTVQGLFSLLASLSHGSDLLKFHGIGPFYHKLLAWRNETQARGKKGSKYARQINESEPFRTMMSRVHIWINTPDFIGHPKLEYLQSIVMNHFLDAGEGRGASDPSNTRIMVFAHYRDSAEEIARILKRNEPMIRPHVFVGQATSKGSEGMDQKRQLDIIQKFKNGFYNTLVATSIGEEGLDIGEVDLIVCYDASASPIRMLQRMGRTGRKRAGNIVVTLMKGKEENNFIKAKDNYEKMQIEIASGARFNFRDDESRRILPKDMQPVVDKKVIEIPPENSQADLPEPTRSGRVPKRPPKKFHLPDDCQKGFVRASRLDDKGTSDEKGIIRPIRKAPTILQRMPVSTTVPVPRLEEVLLTSDEERLFERKYLDIRGDEPQLVELPRVDAYPKLQRTERPKKDVAHSSVTQNTVKMLRAIHGMVEDPSQQFERHLRSEDRDIGTAQAERRAQFMKASCENSVSSDVMHCDYTSTQAETDPARKVTKGRSGWNSKITTVSSSNGMHVDEVIGNIPYSSASELNASSRSLLSTGVEEAVTTIPGSDDELPDFCTLVKTDSLREKPEQGRRRAKRRIVHDESDDE